MSKYIAIIFIFTSVLFLQGCENKNVFSWANPGTDTSIETQLADAKKAMDKGKYSDAIEIYDEILQGDPKNSDALYGKAAAELKNAGLDLEHILKTLIDMAADEENDINPIDKLLEGLNMDTLAGGTEKAEDALKIITNGNADGTIPADDYDVNINLAAIIIFNAYAVMMDDYGVDNIEDLEKDISDPDIEKTASRIEEAKNYAKVALGATHEVIEMLDDIIENLQDLKS